MMPCNCPGGICFYPRSSICRKPEELSSGVYDLGIPERVETDPLEIPKFLRRQPRGLPKP